MDKVYLNFECKNCKKEFILLNQEFQDSVTHGKYISCPHCGSKKVIKTNETDAIKECMKHSSYKRFHGALRQVSEK